MLDKAQEYGRIIKEAFLYNLRQNKAPWIVPFHNRLAYNFVSNVNYNIKPYSSLNQMILSCYDISEYRLYATQYQIANLNTKENIEKLKNNEIKIQEAPIHLKKLSKPKIVLSQYNSYFAPTAEIGTNEYKEQKELLDEALFLKEINPDKSNEMIKELEKDKKIQLRTGGRIYYQLYSINDIEGLDEKFIENEIERFKKYNNLQTVNDLTLTQEEIGDYFINNFFANRPNIKLERMTIGFPHYSYKKDTMQNEEIERKIVLPPKDQSKNLSSYYSTAFHEIAHSEIKDRERENNREELEKKGYSKSDNYAYEEFQVEMTANMLLNYLGLATEFTDKQNVAYCQQYIKSIKKIDDKTFYQCINNACKSYESLINEYEKSREYEYAENKEETVVKNYQR